MAEGRVLLNVRGVVVRSAPSVLLSDRRRVESPRRSPLSPLAKFSQKEDDLILTQPGGILNGPQGEPIAARFWANCAFWSPEALLLVASEACAPGDRRPKTGDGVSASSPCHSACPGRRPGSSRRERGIPPTRPAPAASGPGPIPFGHPLSEAETRLIRKLSFCSTALSAM